MTPQEQRIADALIDRIRQRRDTIDPDVAQRIHASLNNIPDAFYLIAQVVISQGVQLEAIQSAPSATLAPQQTLPVPPTAAVGWSQGQPGGQPQSGGGFLDRLFGSGANQGTAPAYYGQPQPAYGQPAPVPPASGIVPAPGQPIGTAGYQAVNANLPGANASPAPQYSGYGQQYAPSGYAAQVGYPSSGYPAPQAQGLPPQSGYPAPPPPQGFPQQPGYGQPVFSSPPPYPQAGFPPQGGPGFPPAVYPQSGYPGGPSWGQQPGGSMLGGMGGVVAGAAAGALAMGAVESVVHGFENHEHREQEFTREDHHERDQHLAADSNPRDDSSFYNTSHDASRSNDSDSRSLANTSTEERDDNSSSDSTSDDNGSGDASDFGGFSGDDNS